MKPTSQRQKKPNNAFMGKLSEEDGVTKSGRRNNKNCRQRGKTTAILGSHSNDSMDVDKVSVHPALSLLNTGNKGRSSSQSTREVPTSLTRQVHELTLKLKFQLFPIDGITRKVLQEDGHNPHLELILGGKKKMSSVVKHLISKWGNSRVAVGELMLFPYDALPESASKCECWGLKDTKTSASDIHRALGRPAILRLRYGWLLDSPLHGQDSDKLSNMMVADDKVGSCLEANQELTPNVGEPYPPTDKSIAAHRNVDDKGKEKDAAAGVLSWIDGLTSMSFQDLFARANLAFPEATQPCQLPMESNSRPQQIPFSCDSFDAAIAAQLSQMQAPTQPSNCPTSSILDAEETCHGFPVQKNLPKDGSLQSSGNAVVPFGQDVLQPKPTDAVGLYFAIAEGKLFLGIPSNALEETLPKFQSQEFDSGCSEATTGISSQPLVQNCSENSIGLANISWDSGTVDFCLPSRTVVSGSESIGFGSLLSSSRDGHRNCSFSNSDKTSPPPLKLNL